jgi:hypothetical protein
MGIEYKNLDEKTREHMLLEFNIGGFYESPRLKNGLLSTWLEVFSEGIKSYSDDWVANRAAEEGLFKEFEERKTKKGIIQVKVPTNASQMLAEGEFNRFYLRGICSRALSEGCEYIKIYRGKDVSIPRTESEQKIGSLLKVEETLMELRKNTFVDSSLGLPSGPNSGLTAEIVFK